jgi:hypothetical protein
VLHLRRSVKVNLPPKKQHEDPNVDICTCEVWYFFGPSWSKGKKNDHVFHNACLDHISKNMKQRNIEIEKVWTNNCAAQYKCKHAFLSVATFGERQDCEPLSHSFAQVYHFKGNWDAAGKVAKEHIRTMELATKKSESTRVATAYDCFLKLKGPLANDFIVNWSELENQKSHLLRGKGNFGVDARFVGYVTDDPQEYEQLKAKHPDEPILFTDRTSLPKLNSVEGTASFHSVAGVSGNCGNEKEGWKIRTAKMPCSCLACRGKSLVPCPYTDIRQEGTSIIKQPTEQTPEEKASRAASRANDKVTINQLELQVQQILGVPVAVTVEKLQEKLKELKLPKTGKKLDLMKRLIEWSGSQPAQETSATTAFDVGINNIEQLLADELENSDSDDSDADE